MPESNLPKHTTKTAHSAKDIDGLVAMLPEAVRHILADLQGASRRSAEVTISLLPLARRSMLEALKITRTEGAQSSGGATEQRERVRITDWGLQVIAACAAYRQPEVDEGDQKRRVADVRARLSAVPPVID